MSVAGPERLVQLAAVAGAHGVRGHLKLKTFTECPADVAAYGTLLDECGGELFDAEIVSSWKHGVIVRTGSVTDRQTAQAMQGLSLYVRRSALPQTEVNEFYHEDLIGLRAIDGEGRDLGAIAAVHDFGAGDLLEIRGEAGELLVPFTDDVVPEIDLGTGLIRIDPPSELPA